MRTIVLACSLLFAAAAGAAQPERCPARPGQDFSGKNLTDHNFAHRDLTNARFLDAILDGAQFAGANLTCADFSRASLKTSPKGAANFLNANLAGAIFREATLDGANLQFAAVTCTDFSKTDLTTVQFGMPPEVDARRNDCRTKFIDTTMSIHQFPTRLWGHTDFTNTNFVDLTPASFSLRGADITDARLAGIQLGGFDLTDSTLTGVDFTSADLRSARMDRAKASGVKMNGARLRLASATEARFFDQQRLNVKAELRGATAVGADFSKADLSYADLRGANFSESTFAGATLDNAVLQAGEGWNAAQVVAADFSKATFRGTQLNDVSFLHARLVKARFRVQLTGTDFSDSVLTGATFENPSLLQGVRFQKAALQNVTFEKTVMRPSPNGSGVNFTCAQLGGAKLSNDIISASFNAAVMPQRGDCCPGPDGKGVHCGVDPLTREPYAETVLPQLPEGVIVTCPNGEQAHCSGAQWSVPRWRSAACRPEQVWTPPTCGGGDGGDVVAVPDPQFLECLRLSLFGSSQGQQIPRALAATVEEVKCPGRGIENVTGLEAFTALRRLDFSNNEIHTQDIYSKLEKLEVLNLAGNRLTGLSVSRLKKLQSLNASHNRIKGIAGWIAPEALEYLDLSYNELETLNLGTRQSLFYVDLSHNRLTQVVDRQPLSRLISLEYLYLQNNSLRTIGSLKNLAEAGTLSHLSLACNSRFDCASLEIEGTQLLRNSLCGQCTP